MTRAVIFFLVLLCLASDALAGKTVSVRGYYRKDGTYVRPHMRSPPGSGSSSSSSFSYSVPSVSLPEPEARQDYRTSARTKSRAVSRYRSPFGTSRSLSEPLAVRQSVTPREHEFRLWTDITGNFQVMAKFVSMAMGTVKIEKQDGEEISVPFDRLSEADQEYVGKLAR